MKTCHKVRYGGKKSAEHAASTRQSMQGGALLNVYECEQCGGWHLTSQVKEIPYGFRRTENPLKQRLEL